MTILSRLTAVVLAAVCLLAGPVTAAAQESPAAESDTIAAVNGTPITRQTFDSEFQAAMERMAAAGQAPSGIQGMLLRKQVIDSLINEELLVQESNKQGITVSADLINDEIERIKSQFPGEEEFNKALEQRQMTGDDLRKKLERRQAIQQLLEKEVPVGEDPTEADKEKFYTDNPEMFTSPESVRASHILIKLKPDADQEATSEANKKIKDIQDKLDAGEDFAELAKTHSEGPSNVKGGDLGYFTRGKMVKPFEDAAFTLKTGETSPVVQTDFGLHLIRVTDRKSEETVAYKDAEADIARMLVQDDRRNRFEAYMEDLKSKADIQQPDS
ncbi:MAG: peptidylprolyl isomerase [Desulfobacterales bacterium]|jgi:peptidyl-prolyl cis-trans isomerase C